MDKVHNDKGRQELSMKRYSFHLNRRPRLFMEYKGKYYDGVISQYWQTGFRIESKHKLPFVEGNVISNIRLLGHDKDLDLHDLNIMYKATVESGMIVDVTEANTLHLGEFHRQFHIKFLGHSPLQEGMPSEQLASLPAFVGRKHYTLEATEARHQWLKQATGKTYNSIKQSIFHDNPSVLAGNIEQYIGSVQIPVGIAGPLLVKGTYANGYYPIPIATSEGALISSISRGSRGCNASGGVEVHVTRQVMLRAPVFFCEQVETVFRLANWIRDHESEIKAKAESVSSVAKLVRLELHPFGKSLHVQFYYETADAAGQNMTTSCTYFACEWIMDQLSHCSEFESIDYMIEGNMAGDKKVTHRNFSEGRGIQAVASVHISDEDMVKLFRVSSEDYMRKWSMAECGGLQTGMVGHNVNFANVIAGMFTATGQDIACVHESSVGIFKPIRERNGISFHLQLPALVIGTVGGGTHLPTQRECLEMMDCYGQGNVYKLAEIIASACLALDISTSTAIGTHQFVKAHEKLGRKASATGISRTEITSRFFQSLIGDQQGKVTSFETVSMDTTSSVVTNMLKKKKNQFQGLYRYRLNLQDGLGQRTLPAVLKVKSGNTDMIELGVAIAKLSGDDRLCGLFESQVHIFGFEWANVRELALYEHASPSLLRYCPDIYGMKNDSSKGAFAILMEDLSDCSHLNAVNTTEMWDDHHIQVVLDDLAGMHAVYLDQEALISDPIQAECLDGEAYQESKELLLALTAYNRERFPELMCEQLYQSIQLFIHNLPSCIEKMEQYHQTLTHNDFNTRNIALRNVSGRKQLVVYDWELARFQNPQHDALEFLVYALAPETTVQQFDYYLDRYRMKLESECNMPLKQDEFHQIALLNALELAAVRFNLYLLANNLLHLPYMSRIYHNLSRFILNKIDILAPEGSITDKLLVKV